ncbi:P68 family surface lipoprotein [Mycoplasma sp. 1654_15]|uniref:P68 family surface lipoprotein n=1 Tax=Mycoplasma sp. 1654_15 TaxID=2725994 RepID=UPI001448BDD4|nr:hypothetical protein [Mycoplasma sp. 1654_15]QJB71316.1 hypothetical protein HF996_02390 [Mycoplasma sp. 1654_15]
MKKKIIKSLATGFGLLAPIAILASCGETEKTTINFATSQGEFWPMMMGMKEIIKIYNEQHKNDADFLPVELLAREKSKQDSEAGLLSQLQADLTTGKGNWDIILGNKATAYVANSFNKLLDVGTQTVNPNSFPKKIIDNYNKLLGSEGTNTLKSLPYNINDTDGIVFNLDIMNVLFDIIQSNGGTIDENSEIAKKVKESVGKGHSIPKNSMFSAIKIKESSKTTGFSGFTVNDSTFSDIKKAFEFAQKIYDNTEIDTTKLDADVKDTEIFAIDYASDVFRKQIMSKENKSFWTEESLNNNDLQLKVNIKTDQDLRTKVSNQFEEWENALKQTQFVGTTTGEGEAKKTQWTTKDIVTKTTTDSVQNNDGKTFYSVKFTNFFTPEINQWGSFEVRQYLAAFTYAPLVGTNYSVDSPWARGFFAADLKDGKQKAEEWTTRDDVYATNQAMRSDENAQFSSYNAGGSSLIAVKSNNEKVNKNIKKFIDFLYNGTGLKDLTGADISAADFMAEQSAYFIPTTTTITQNKINELKTRQSTYKTKLAELDTQIASKKAEAEQIQAKVAKHEKDTTQPDATEAEKTKLTDFNTLKGKRAKFDIAINNLTSVIISIDSALKFVNNEKTGILPQPANTEIIKIPTNLTNALFESTKKDKPTHLTKEDFLTKLLNNVQIN